MGHRDDDAPAGHAVMYPELICTGQITADYLLIYRISYRINNRYIEFIQSAGRK